MEKLVKKLNSLRQELVISQRYNYVSTRGNVKSFSQCIIELDKLLDDFESELFPSIINNDDFKKAVEPAIRYLLNNHNPHTKIIIDYSNAELVQSQKCCNLNNEIPD